MKRGQWPASLTYPWLVYRGPGRVTRPCIRWCSLGPARANRRLRSGARSLAGVLARGRDSTCLVEPGLSAAEQVRLGAPRHSCARCRAGSAPHRRAQRVGRGPGARPAARATASALLRLASPASGRGSGPRTDPRPARRSGRSSWKERLSAGRMPAPAPVPRAQAACRLMLRQEPDNCRTQCLRQMPRRHARSARTQARPTSRPSEG
jgi:hypothetical protein